MQISKRRKLAVGTIVLLGLLTFVGTGFLAWRLSNNETLDANDASAGIDCYSSESNTYIPEEAIARGKFCIPSDIRGVVPGGKMPGNEVNHRDYYYFETSQTQQLEVALEYPQGQDLSLTILNSVTLPDGQLDLKGIGYSNEVGNTERISLFIPAGKYFIKVHNDKGTTFQQRESYRLKSSLKNTEHQPLRVDRDENSQLPYCDGANIYINDVAKGSNKVSLDNRDSINVNSFNDKVYFKVAVLDRTYSESKTPKPVQLCFSVAGMPESYYKNYYDGGVSVFSCEYITPTKEEVPFSYKKGSNIVWKAQTKEMTYEEHAKKLLNIPGIKNGGKEQNIVPALTQQEILDKGFIFIMNAFDDETRNICSSNQSFNKGTGTMFESARGKTIPSNCATYGPIDSPSYCNARVGFEAFNETR